MHNHACQNKSSRTIFSHKSKCPSPFYFLMTARKQHTATRSSSATRWLCRKAERLRASDSAIAVSTSQPGGFSATSIPAGCTKILGFCSGNSSRLDGMRRHVGLHWGTRSASLQKVGYAMKSITNLWLQIAAQRRVKFQGPCQSQKTENQGVCFRFAGQFR